MSSHVPKLKFAAKSDPGMRRLANEDAVAMEPRLGLFVVCDGIGGRPSGEAAAQIISYTLAHALRRRVRKADALSEQRIKEILAAGVQEMNDQLHRHSHAAPALTGMGCTIVAALLDAKHLYYAHAGDSRLYLLRKDELHQLTEDHTQTGREVTENDHGDLIANERRYLLRYIGMPAVVTPSVDAMPLQPGDRVLLCSDGLTDPVEHNAILHLLRHHAEPDLAVQALVNQANANGGPDNITLAVVDYAGPRKTTEADMQKPPKTPPQMPAGIAEATHAALQQLEQDLDWLLQGARESANPNRLSALAAAKRRLGKDHFRTFLARHPDQAPSFVFHQFCTDPQYPWRKQYEQHLQQLKEPLKQIMSGRVRLSTVLTGDETAAIYRDLWTGWRRVENRYFMTCQREAQHTHEGTLDVLIDHMLQSVQTLSGLLEFLPRFMRDGVR